MLGPRKSRPNISGHLDGRTTCFSPLTEFGINSGQNGEPGTLLFRISIQSTEKEICLPQGRTGQDNDFEQKKRIITTTLY